MVAMVDPDADQVAPHASRRGNGHPVLAFDADQQTPIAYRARAFVFSDPRSRMLLPLIDKVAPSDATIMITGETGTGKELVARYIHSRSDRSNAPFVAVNCGAFSETLIDSELFGNERGAYTGAAVARAGWFEAANGGTLFLDEIGDLPHALQVKLLRVLQEHEVVRLGSRKAIPLDVRLIAATNANLEKLVAEGHFRADLFYRLNVVSIPLLPLRERRADILPLARHFLAAFGAAAHRTGRLDLSPAAEEALYAHAWPGNIRELENALQRATLTCQDGRVQPSDLQLSHGPLDDATLSAHAGAAPSLEENVAALVRRSVDAGEDEVLERIVKAAVLEAYQTSDGNQIRTATALGITRNVVRTHLKNFGLI